MIFENATILTLNPDREIIEHGAVVVNGKNITAVGKSKDLIEQYPQEQRVDCRSGILMPGLVDAHVHLTQCMLRGMSDDKDLEVVPWLRQRIWPLLGSYSPEDALASSSLCVLEMIKSGTTGFIEVLLGEHYGFDGIADMVGKSGIRSALGKIVMDMPAATRDELGVHPNMWEERERSIETALAAFDRWNGTFDGRLEVWFGARTAGDWSNSSLYPEIRALANERNMGITIHFAETEGDVAYARSQGYRTLTEYGLAKGILGPRTVLAHYIYSEPEDWPLLVQSGTSVSHNPGSNQKYAWGPARVVGMLDAGVNVALGCDAGAANNNMDMVRDMRIACHAARIKAQDMTIMSGETAIEMATLNGARAMGFDNIAGSIEAGKRADFIVIDVDKPHMQPMWSPVAAVVFSASGSDVDTVVVNGQILMQGRKVLTMDEEAIVDDASRRWKDIARKAGVVLEPRWPTR